MLGVGRSVGSAAVDDDDDRPVRSRPRPRSAIGVSTGAVGAVDIERRARGSTSTAIDRRHDRDADDRRRLDLLLARPRRRRRPGRRCFLRVRFFFGASIGARSDPLVGVASTIISFDDAGTSARPISITTSTGSSTTQRSARASRRRPASRGTRSPSSRSRGASSDIVSTNARAAAGIAEISPAQAPSRSSASASSSPTHLAKLRTKPRTKTSAGNPSVCPASSFSRIRGWIFVMRAMSSSDN